MRRCRSIPALGTSSVERAARFSLAEGLIERPYTIECDQVKYTICQIPDQPNQYACVPLKEVMSIQSSTLCVNEKDRKNRDLKLKLRIENIKVMELEMELEELRVAVQKLKIEKVLMMDGFAAQHVGYELVLGCGGD